MSVRSRSGNTYKSFAEKNKSHKSKQRAYAIASSKRKGSSSAPKTKRTK